LSTDPTGGGSLTVAELFEEYKDRLHRYAMGLTRDSNRANDLLQETFIRAMTHIELLNQLNPYQRRAWLYRVLKNRFIDQQRARQREQALLGQLVELVEVESHSFVDARLYGLFDLVPERYRDLLKKRYVLGMTSQEMGEKLGVPAATVRSRLRLAIKWLRTHQSEYM
jgi:RNA polymerase sigma-70 factor (ECF subfamily)